MAPNCRHPSRRAPRSQPRLERPARGAVGSAGVSVLGEGKAASRRKRAFPSHALERALGPGRATPPCPSRRSGKSQSPHTGTRRPQGRALRRAAPTANCHGNPGVRSIPHPAGPPHFLPALQPTGLSASRERAIKPKPVRPGNRGGRPTCSRASGADLRRPVLFLKARGKSLIMQSVQSPPKRCIGLAFLLLHVLGQVSGAPLRCLWLLCPPGRPLLGARVAPPSIVPAESFVFLVPPAPGRCHPALSHPVSGPVSQDAANLRPRGASGAGRLFLLSGVRPPARRELLPAGAVRGEPRPLLRSQSGPQRGNRHLHG